MGPRGGLAGGGRHPVVGVDGEGVVEVGVQLADGHARLRQPRAGRLVAHLLAAGLARGAVAAPALHAVCEVGPAPRVPRRAPCQQHPAGRQLGGGLQVLGGPGQTWGRRERGLQGALGGHGEMRPRGGLLFVVLVLKFSYEKNCFYEFVQIILFLLVIF